MALRLPNDDSVYGTQADHDRGTILENAIEEMNGKRQKKRKVITAKRNTI